MAGLGELCTMEDERVCGWGMELWGFDAWFARLCGVMESDCSRDAFRRGSMNVGERM